MATLVVPIVPRETRDYVDGVIKDFGRGRISHWAMIATVAEVLEEYRLKRLPLGGYEVIYFGEVDGLPVIHIQGRAKVNEKCPACGSDKWKYINTEKEQPMKDYDIVTAFCLDCSCFYRLIGWKVDRHANHV